MKRTDNNGLTRIVAILAVSMVCFIAFIAASPLPQSQTAADRTVRIETIQAQSHIFRFIKALKENNPFSQ